ncbi:OLC1v1011647C1 [Oldenlandia corymbosa var. corymbosa]|uniref:OLC1v1011647C1 n=1 Tax=Oldenlandia corymbosa var. corymbosa TaxID=529605 RepID=A0AAV1DU54_OLDCO|nr:OLC1v1011647C1 [Oldenlandia corymbosa var. corymbosa]
MSNHHRRPQNPNRKAPKQGGNGQAPLHPGSVIFRILCHVDTAGGVIGNSGHLIKLLETQTGCRIRFEEPLPNCHERVINVIGDASIDRKIKLRNENEDLGGWPPQLGDDHGAGECLEMEVSSAQSGLMRVFERILQVKKNESIGVTGCRLLAGLGQVGGVMGKGGKIVLEMQKNSGAKIRVLNKDQTPSCAGPGEELIQITGDVMAVKKALVAVSHCLQVCQLPVERKKSHLSPHPKSQDPQADYLENYDMPQSVPGSDFSSFSSSLAEDVQNIMRFDNESAQRNVVFKLLCSNVSAGGVIGKGASIVRELEKETGASIKFSSPAAGLKDRIATISSMEGRDSSVSSAQNAIVLVFARSVEVDPEKGYLSDLSGSGTVNARILVTPNEIKCLKDDGGRIASDISATFSVKIQLLEPKHAPNGHSANDKVVLIVGEYEKVKSALFQVTGRLRDNFFSSSAPGETVPRHSATPSSSPLVKCSTPQSENAAELNQIGQGFALQNSFHRPKLPHEQFEDMRKARNTKDRAKNRNGKAVHQKSNVADAVVIPTLEILVPGKAFANVYGENGSNLTRIIEISGAKVTVEDPCRGRSEGKVIISGTQESIFVAQSLLQAFIGV